MKTSTFDVKERRKHLAIFKVGKLWVFKYFFDDKELFKALLSYYNQDNYRFEFKTVGERNNALKLLERSGVDYDFVEDLRGYVVKLPKYAKYAPTHKNSVAYKETTNERMFLMKDLAAVEEGSQPGQLGADLRGNAAACGVEAGLAPSLLPCRSQRASRIVPALLIFRGQIEKVWHRV